MRSIYGELGACYYSRRRHIFLIMPIDAYWVRCLCGDQFYRGLQTSTSWKRYGLFVGLRINIHGRIMTTYRGARVSNASTLPTVGNSSRPMTRLSTSLCIKCYIADCRRVCSIGAETCDLLDKLLTCNPSDRITATDALDHDYFWTDPLPADPKT